MLGNGPEILPLLLDLVRSATFAEAGLCRPMIGGVRVPPLKEVATPLREHLRSACSEPHASDAMMEELFALSIWAERQGHQGIAQALLEIGQFNPGIAERYHRKRKRVLSEMSIADADSQVNAWARRFAP